MQHSAEVQGYALGWQSGGAAEEDPASTYLQGQDGTWDYTSQYSEASCALGAQACMAGQGEQWGCYGHTYNGCYGAYSASTYDAATFGYASGCGSYGFGNRCVLNLDQYSDASDSGDEKEPEEKALGAKLAAGVATPAAGVTSDDTSPKEALAPAGTAASATTAEVAEPAPEPTHGGARGVVRLPATPARGEEACAEEVAESPRMAGSVAEEAGSAISEPEAEASGHEQEPPSRGVRAAAAADDSVEPAASAAASEGGNFKAEAAMVTHGRTKLQVSSGSWAAQQRARRASASAAGSDNVSDAEVVRRMKSILNKLTIEKFSVLYTKLVESGIKTAGHAEALIREVFEKATTQHHFVDMYADLCALLQEHFENNPVSDDSRFSFRRLLLNECQASFERNLAPPAEFQLAEHDERTLLEFQYKTRMIGNIRFVGALLTRKMLACKVMFAIIQELLAHTTPEALESLAVLLTVVGPTFDTPDWQYCKMLNACFQQVRAIAQKASCNPRARCLLKDLLDLRARGWQDSRPKRCEGPTTLEDVARQVAAEGRAAMTGAATATAATHGALQPRALWAPRAPAGANAAHSGRAWQLQECPGLPASPPQQGRRFVPKSPPATPAGTERTKGSG